MYRRLAAPLGIIALSGVAGPVPQAVAAPATAVLVRGAATGTLANAAGATVNVANVRLKEDGGISGTFRVTVSGQPTDINVDVDQAFPPTPGGHSLIGDGFFCISGPDTTQQPGVRYNLYIRDIGNGKTTFDEWGLVSGFDCSTTGRPNVETPTSGDFQTAVVTPR